MKTFKPTHVHRNACIKLKSTLLLFAFAFFSIFAPDAMGRAFAKSNTATQHLLLNNSICKHIVVDGAISDPEFHQYQTDTSNVLCENLIFMTGFSPDGDSEYHTFTIIGVEKCPNNFLSIFDKWGQEIYTKKGYQNDWDGMVNGRMMELGTYYYMFSDGQGKTYSGYVNIESDI